MYRVVIDPRVLIAALLSSNGAPAMLVRAWLEGRFDLIACPHLLAELGSVLLRSRFRPFVTEEQAREYVGLFHRFATLVSGSEIQPGLTPDPGNDYLVALAQSVRAQFLISGDAHLTGLTSPFPPVLTPRAFLDCWSRGKSAAGARDRAR